MALKHYIPLLALVALLAASCANIGKPNGGPRDTKGPEVLLTDPPNQTVNFEGRDIEIEFNEFLKPGSYASEIFISPVPEVKPEVRVRNKKLYIRLNDTLRHNTTYVITIGTGIKDFSEGNKMSKPYLYAFSTGPVLDSLRFGGKVTDPMKGKGSGSLTLLLFRAENLENDSIEGRIPDYATQTQATGEFNFAYLSPGKYKIYGIKDANSNYMYDPPSEVLALAADPLFEITGDTAQEAPRLDLYAFVPDTAAPNPKSPKWLNEHSFELSFSEFVRTGFKGDSLRIELTDTSGENGKVPFWAFTDHKQNKIHVYSGRGRSEIQAVLIHNLMDSLGNKQDTLYRIAPGSERSKEADPFGKATWSDRYSAVVIPVQRPLPDSLPDSFLTVLDTGKKAFPVSILMDKWRILVRPEAKAQKGMPYTLTIPEDLEFADGTRPDSARTFRFPFPDPAEYAQVSGRILPDSTDSTAVWLLLLKQAGGKNSEIVKRTSGETEFSWPMLKAGKYEVIFIKDDNGDGYYTPGSLHPYRLPEKVIVMKSPLEIKPNWIYEDMEFQPVVSEGGGKKGKDLK